MAIMSLSMKLVVLLALCFAATPSAMAAGDECFNILKDFYEECWDMVATLGNGAQAMASMQRAPANMSRRGIELLSESDIRALVHPMPSQRCCDATSKFLLDEYMTGCGNHAKVHVQMQQFNKAVIDALLSHITLECGSEFPPTGWTGAAAESALEVRHGPSRKLLGCDEGDGYETNGNPFCKAGYGHCWGDTCIYGSEHYAEAQCFELDCSCFPGSATVDVLDGGSILTKHMRDLAVGEKVRTVSHTGKVEFSDVYFFGHEIGHQLSTFVRLDLASLSVPHGSHAMHRTLFLTGDHFIPVSSNGAVKADGGACTWGARTMYRARDVTVGMTVFASSNASLELEAYQVMKTSLEMKEGLYNPYTLNGNIVVDGIVSSSHSSWILDGLFDTLGLTSSIPAMYQALFFPLRLVYMAIGANAMPYLMWLPVFLSNNIHLEAFVCNLALFVALTAGVALTIRSVHQKKL